MTTKAATKSAEETLRLERRFKAAPGQVFDAFTKPEQLKQWWGPPGFTTPKAEMDVRPGGAYAIDMRSPGGSLHRIRGTFEVIDRPRKLVYSWAWQEGGYAGIPTLVTLDFIPDGTGTLLRVTHEGMTTTAMMKDHTGGWTASLAKLDPAIEAGLA
jgi:uncharacterized protein YndB with AHSA1/START domain